MTRKSYANDKRTWPRHKADDQRSDFNDAPGPVQRARLKDLDDLDQRSRALRRAKKMMAQMESDLGGPDHVTRAQKELIQRATFISLLLNDMEARWHRQEEQINVGKYTALVNSQGRIINALGLRRIARDVTPSVDEYLRRKRIGHDVEDAEEVAE